MQDRRARFKKIHDMAFRECGEFVGKSSALPVGEFANEKEKEEMIDLCLRRIGMKNSEHRAVVAGVLALFVERKEALIVNFMENHLAEWKQCIELGKKRKRIDPSAAVSLGIFARCYRVYIEGQEKAKPAGKRRRGSST